MPSLQQHAAGRVHTKTRKIALRPVKLDCYPPAALAVRTTTLMCYLRRAVDHYIYRVA